MNSSDIVLSDLMIKRSVISEGDPSRIARIMRKAKAGEDITVGFIGGSVTQGFKSSAHQNCYAAKVKEWWRKTFPESSVDYINVGIGATGSVIGVHRVKKDLLCHQPDFIIAEFSVNDLPENLQKETYENLVRRILKNKNSPALLLLFMTNKFGKNAQSIHKQIGEHYRLPMISYGDAVWLEIELGHIRWEELSPDDVHPNDTGHELAAALVIHYLESIYRNLDSIAKPIYEIKAPLVSDAFENADMILSEDFNIASWGSFIPVHIGINKFPTGLTAMGGTKPLIIRLKNRQCKKIFLLYKRTNNGTGGKAEIKVNGKTPVIVDSDFKDGWGEYPAFELIYESEADPDIDVYIQPVLTAENESFSVIGLLVS